jgi:L-2-hydroxyglutarate oxidase LhgO
MPEKVECAVVGAGVVGLAIARAFALAGHEVVLLEKESVFGSGASSRNSEVLHAGMYYATGSLKARLCVAGNRQLRQYLTERKIDHRMVGKLIVATHDDERPKLQAILTQGRINGVEQLDLWDGNQACALEPALNCVAALHSPLTGIFDSHAYMLSLLGDLEAAGGTLVRNSPVLGGVARADGVLLQVGGVDPIELLCATVINAAGLGAQGLARNLAGLPAGHVPPLHFCKGNYFLLSGKPPFASLVYPLPDNASIGLHYTLDLGGQGRFGPDVEWTEREDYQVDPTRVARFTDSIRRYWPDLPEDALRPGYAGIRPKIQAPEEPPHDFMIEGPAHHGVAGLVNLFGIESPGLTASLALADTVLELLQ